LPELFFRHLVYKFPGLGPFLLRHTCTYHLNHLTGEDRSEESAFVEAESVGEAVEESGSVEVACAGGVDGLYSQGVYLDDFVAPLDP